MVMAETYAQARTRPSSSRSTTSRWTPSARSTARPTGPQIWDSAPGNRDASTGRTATKTTCNAAFAKAAHVVGSKSVQNRVSANLDGDAQRHRRLRRGEGSLHALCPATRARANCATAWRKGVLEHPAREGARHHQGCRRRLRHEGVPLSRAAAGADRGEEDRPPGALERRPHRSVPHRRSRPRHDHHAANWRSTRTARSSPCASPARRTWAAISRSIAPFIPTLAGGRIFGGVYRVPDAVREHQGLFLQLRAGRRLSRRGPPGSRLSDGAADGCGRAPRPASTAPRSAGAICRRRPNCPTSNWSGVKFDSGDYPRLLEEGARSAPTGRASRRARRNRQARQAARLRLRLLCRDHRSRRAANRRRSSSPTMAASSSMSARSRTGRGTRPRSRSSSPRSSACRSRSITVKQGDTDWVNGGGTGGSRSLNMSGGALLGCRPTK